MEAGESALRSVDRVAIAAAPVFSWSVGNHMERFFDGLKQGKFMGSRCPQCGRVYLPPRMICDRCFTEAEEWVELPGSGTVESFTVAHVKVAEDGDLEDRGSPELIGMVRHEGANTCLVAALRGFESGEVTVGMKVRAVLDESPEGVLDILSHYEPDR